MNIYAKAAASGLVFGAALGVVTAALVLSPDRDKTYLPLASSMLAVFTVLPLLAAFRGLGRGYTQPLARPQR